MEIQNIRYPLSEGSTASESSFVVNALGLLAASALVCVCFRCGMKQPVDLFMTFVVLLLAFTVGLETLFFPRRCAILQHKVRRRLSWRRVVFREAALIVTLAAIGLAYWAIPAFSDKPMLKHYYPFLKLLIPIALCLSLPYFCLMDKIDVEEEDAMCRVGRALLTFKKTMSRFEFANYVRSWIIKAFWLSLMQPAVVERMRVFMYYHWEKLQGSPVEVYLMASTICYAIDLAYASTGYIFNIKLFNAQTRTAEPSLLGWVVALMCYWPFWGVLLMPYFFNYEMPSHWFNVMFSIGSPAWWAWAGIIILLELLYALSSVSAGIRFSNLTYRGLWNTGPYRLTKHPAYVFKCLSWWFISAPLFVGGGLNGARCALMLFAANVLYYLRARTEERHLSHYPEYVAYAMEMNEKSIFRWVARLLPFLRYRPPTKSDLMFNVEERRWDLPRASSPQ